FAAQRGGSLRGKLAQPVAVERAEPPRAHAMQREERKTRDAQEIFSGFGPRRDIPKGARSAVARARLGPGRFDLRADRTREERDARRRNPARLAERGEA